VQATNAHGLASSTVSDSVIVANSAPTAGSVAITPAKPYAGDALTAAPSGFTDADSDSLTYQYTWYQDGQAIAGQTGSTLPGNLVTGGTVKVEVTADDGNGGTSQVASDSVSVFGSPTAGTVKISPADPTTNQVLTATPSGFSDTQGGALTYSYQWLVNGKSIQDGPSATFDLSQPGHGDHGDKVAVKVTAGNANGNSSEADSDTVTVVNTAPTEGSVAITPSDPTAGMALTATPSGFADADGDQLHYEYTWLENGQPIATQTGNVLPGTWVLAGKVTVQVSAVDGHGGTSQAATSAPVDVAPAMTLGGGGTTSPGTGLGSDTPLPPITGHSSGGAPLQIVVSNPNHPVYRLGQSLVVRYSCSAGSGIAKCVATLGLPGAKPVPVSSGKNLELSKTGRYVLRITATDRKGSTQTTTVYFRVTSDRNPPAIVINSPKGRTYRLGQSLVVRFSCHDGSGIAGCAATLARVGGRPSKVSTGSKMPLTKPGRYVLRIRATDGVGNAASKTLSFSVK
jgi:hypothetical protein